MQRIVTGLIRGALVGVCAIVGALVMGAPRLAHAQAATSAPAAAANPTNPLEEVVITGTRRTDRTATDSASPIDVITSTELQQQPAANMLDVVKNVVPSFYVGQNTISDASSLVRAPSLRGLPGDQVLVMLNGKRFNRSALVQVYNGGDTGLSFGSQGSDLSTIPAISIKSLEVLRDGATAQYGSDAIAGVFNFGLREDAGFEVQARYGQYQHSDGDSWQFAGYGGFKFAGAGFVSLSAEYNDDLQTSRGVTRPVAVAFAEENPNLAGQLPNYPLPAQIWGSSPTHALKFMLNSGFEVTDASKLYLFGNFAHIHTDESFNFRSSLIGTRPFTDTTGAVHDLGGRSFFQHPYYNTQCPAGNATCPADGYVEDSNTFLLSSIYPAGFTPRFIGKIDQAFGTLGYKGKVGGLGYDLSTSLSDNELDLSMNHSTSPSFGGASQTSFEFGKQIQKETDVNLDLTYEINAGLASPLTLSGGGEYRRESFTATAGDFQSYGAGPYASPHPLYIETSPGVFAPTGTFTAAESPAASGYGGTSPTYAGTHTQDSRAVYLGLEGDVVKQLSMGVAGRYERYSSFGDATVGKFNTIWHVTDAIALRATIGSGFHAPSPGQNNTQILTTNFINGISVQTGTFPVTSAVAQYYGAVPLKPEKSTNYGAGVVLNPTSNFTATIDWYKIDVRDRIFISQNFFVTAADIAALPELASVGEGGAVQFFTNAFNTTTKGVDVVGTYHTEFASGGLNLTLAYNYNKSDVTKYDPAVISNAQIIDVSRLAPNHRGTLSANWTSGNWAVNLRENYYGSWVNAVDYPSVLAADGSTLAGQEFGAKWTTDLDLNYSFKEHYTVTIGASNLFNTHPDKIAASATNPIYTLTGGLADGQVYPRNGGPFGINGGFLYAAVRAKF